MQGVPGTRIPCPNGPRPLSARPTPRSVGASPAVPRWVPSPMNYGDGASERAVPRRARGIPAGPPTSAAPEAPRRWGWTEPLWSPREGLAPARGMGVKRPGVVQRTAHMTPLAGTPKPPPTRPPPPRAPQRAGRAYASRSATKPPRDRPSPSDPPPLPSQSAVAKAATRKGLRGSPQRRIGGRPPNAPAGACTPPGWTYATRPPPLDEFAAASGY